MNQKNLQQIWQQVPVHYYEEGIKNNLFQWTWHSLKMKAFKKLVNHQQFDKILDIGCAGGTLTNKISQIFPQSYISGVDVYSDAIEFAKKKYPHIKFIKADAHNLPFKSNFFDLVICYETIEHVDKPEQVLIEIRKVLSKKGVAIITMDSGNLLFRITWWFWEKTKGRVWSGAHLHPFHHRELEEVIKKAGFKIQKKHFSHLGMEVSFVLSK